MCLNTPDSKQLCPLLHQNGFEVTSTSDVDFALKLIDEGHFNLILIEALNENAQIFAEKIIKHPTVNGLLISKNKQVPFCVFEKGLLGHINLENTASLIAFLKSYFKQIKHTILLKKPIDPASEIVAHSRSMLNILDQVKKIAKTQSSVLITGESGTGKEVIAKLIHDQSLRVLMPFVAINSCAISPTLLESELFGYEKGAFTGALSRKMGRLEYANHGTFFFDEVGETPLELQAKLLRVLQERSFERVGGLESIKLNIRFIAATNKNLEEAINKKEFREDLFYRLNVMPLHLPPLRERIEDIIPLALHFLKTYMQKNHSATFTLSDCAQAWLKTYNWPGNIRELFNVLERALVLSNDHLITAKDLMPKSSKLSQTEIGEDFSLENLEKRAVKQALEKTGGNKTQAAKLLGLSIKTLRSKILN